MSTIAKYFEEEWKRGHPLIISNVENKSSLWRPKTFAKLKDQKKCNLYNCKDGAVLKNQLAKEFWDGFDYVSKRLRNECNEPMVLKMKDWPEDEIFSKVLPEHYDDFVQSLPLADYTKLNGQLNIVSRLPKSLNPPDLGPKLYSAYGSNEKIGTTNLHSDISDAINIMTYASATKDEPTDTMAYNALNEAGCDDVTKQRLINEKKLPGAIWHIYKYNDVPKIRQFLKDLAKKKCKEKGEEDPIHNQRWYLDEKLRDQLKREYEIEGYCIVQCEGDAVVIPAGSPHQVQNIFNCIKVAADFVSP